MRRIVSKPENRFLEVEQKTLHFNLKALNTPINLTEHEIDDLRQLQQIADGHCRGLGEPKWFMMNTQAINSNGVDHYPVQFFGR